MDEKKTLLVLSSLTASLKQAQTRADYLRGDLNEKELRVAAYEKNAAGFMRRLFRRVKGESLADYVDEYNRAKDELTAAEEEIGALEERMARIRREAEKKLPSLGKTIQVAKRQAGELLDAKSRVLAVIREGYLCLRQSDLIIAALDEDALSASVPVNRGGTGETDPDGLERLAETKQGLRENLLKFKDGCLRELPEEKRPVVSEGFLEWVADNIARDAEQSAVVLRAAQKLQPKIITMLCALVSYRAEIERKIEAIVYF